MDQLLENIFITRKFINSNKEVIEIHSETSRQQCEYLQDIIRQNKFCKSIEIGFAYGISALAIIEAVAENGGIHIVIDPFQLSVWGGNGLDLIRQAGYSGKLKSIEEYSYKVLPFLLSENKRFDFAYIDSTKQFDFLLVDFFYLDKILKLRGVIVFDDVSFPGIRKLLRYITQFSNYKIYSQFPKNYSPSALRKIAGILKGIPLVKKMVKEEILLSDFKLGINTNCVALIKIDDDKRSWDWHVNF